MLLAFCSPAYSQTIEERLAEVDEKISEQLPSIQSEQESYFNDYLSYDQKLKTHDSAGAFDMEVHVYHGPQGKGYIVIATVIESPEVRWIRQIGFGSEERDQAWTRIGSN